MYQPKKITTKEASNIINKRKPLGLFWFEVDGTYVGIDNKSGDAFTENFKNQGRCIQWLIGDWTGLERKFLIKSIPESLELQKITYIQQNYILATNEEEIRIRIETNEPNQREYTLEYKKDKGAVRFEPYEIPLTENSFKKLEQVIKIANKTKPIKKERLYFKPFDKKIKQITIDSFYNKQLNGLQILEVEFYFDIDMAQFNPPEWFGQEVTDNTNYYNSHLWKKINNIGGDL